MPKIDMDLFTKDVYNIVKEIPFGQVTFYGEIARLTGWPQHARLVGTVLSKVTPEQKLPCHRVVDSQGRTVPGWESHRQLLEAEGIVFSASGRINMKRYAWKVK